MAGRRRKNTVAGSKKESPKTQNTLQETNVSTDKEATKADVKKQAEDVNEKKTADAKIVEDKKVQTETKAADATVKKATTATEKKTTGLKQTASKTETNKKADAPKKRGRKPGSNFFSGYLKAAQAMKKGKNYLKPENQLLKLKSKNFKKLFLS